MPNRSVSHPSSQLRGYVRDDAHDRGDGRRREDDHAHDDLPRVQLRLNHEVQICDRGFPK